MKIPDLINFAKKLAPTFKGNPEGLFNEADKAAGLPMGGVLRRLFNSFKEGTLKPSSQVGAVFNEVAPSAFNSLKTGAAADSAYQTILLECIELEQKCGRGSKDRPDRPVGSVSQADIDALSAYRDGLKSTKPPAAAPVAATAPAVATMTAKPAATTPAPHIPKVTAESIGKAVISTITSPAAAIREPAQAALGMIQQCAKAEAVRPDFSCVRGLEAASMILEFERLGGLSERNHGLYMLRRRQFCEKHKMTPEAMNGEATSRLPKKLTPEEIKNVEATKSAEKSLPGRMQSYNDINKRIADTVRAGSKNFGSLLEQRARIVRTLNQCEAVLGKPLSK